MKNDNKNGGIKQNPAKNMQLNSNYALPIWYVFNFDFNIEIVENSVENVKNFDNTVFLMARLYRFCKVFLFTEQMNNKKTVYIQMHIHCKF